jgi:hypothetical protein
MNPFILAYENTVFGYNLIEVDPVSSKTANSGGLSSLLKPK